MSFSFSLLPVEISQKIITLATYSGPYRSRTIMMHGRNIKKLELVNNEFYKLSKDLLNRLYNVYWKFLGIERRKEFEATNSLSED